MAEVVDATAGVGITIGIGMTMASRELVTLKVIMDCDDSASDPMPATLEEFEDDNGACGRRRDDLSMG